MTGSASVTIPEGFTAWEGGENPVPEGTKVNVIYRDGLRGDNTQSQQFRWQWRTGMHSRGDIVAYKVVG